MNDYSLLYVFFFFFSQFEFSGLHQYNHSAEKNTECFLF